MIHVFLRLLKLEHAIFLIVKIPGIRETEDFQAQMARSAEFGSFQGARSLGKLIWPFAVTGTTCQVPV